MNVIMKFHFPCLSLFVCPHCIVHICVDFNSVWNVLRVSDLTQMFCQWCPVVRSQYEKKQQCESDSDRWYRRLLEVSLLDSKYSRVSADIHFSQPLAIPISLVKILLCWVTASISSSTVNCGKCIIGVKVCNILASEFMDFKTFYQGYWGLG